MSESQNNFRYIIELFSKGRNSPLDICCCRSPSCDKKCCNDRCYNCCHCCVSCTIYSYTEERFSVEKYMRNFLSRIKQEIKEKTRGKIRYTEYINFLQDFIREETKIEIIIDKQQGFSVRKEPENKYVRKYKNILSKVDVSDRIYFRKQISACILRYTGGNSNYMGTNPPKIYKIGDRYSKYNLDTNQWVEEKSDGSPITITGLSKEKAEEFRNILNDSLFRGTENQEEYIIKNFFEFSLDEWYNIITFFDPPPFRGISRKIEQSRARSFCFCFCLIFLILFFVIIFTILYLGIARAG